MAFRHHNGAGEDGAARAQAVSDVPTGVDTGENLSFSHETILHFSQFPAGQYRPESFFNPQISTATQRALMLPTDVGDANHPNPFAMLPTPVPIYQVLQPQPSAAQWSLEDLNPFVPQFIDMELDREPSETSVVEDGSILGESGRTYHGYKGDTNVYLLPNDPAEQDRLDLQHAILTYLWEGRLVLANLPRAPRLVLDVATGTGIWALEFARANPTSFVVGTDLSKIQPVPDVPNCLFERMDCEDDWMWSYKYDYIHARMIVAAIRDPQRLIRQAFEYLNPGGWFEIDDAYGDLVSEEGPEADERVATSKLRQWWSILNKGTGLIGIDTYKALKYKKWLIEAGFTNVTERKFKFPCTPWPKDPKAKRVGQLMHANYLSGMRGVGFKTMRAIGMSPPEIDTLIEDIRNELEYDNIRGYTPVYVVCGRKPFEHEIADSG
ncbi:S-adenosyl-L-methionine-dependent methyltransferase [Xylariales sp. PMI_506]|nr:S-adenosyl-L-methionine-dependent methyltransferase [Xylariales sp. PMI_506]